MVTLSIRYRQATPSAVRYPSTALLDVVSSILRKQLLIIFITEVHSSKIMAEHKNLDDHNRQNY